VRHVNILDPANDETGAELVRLASLYEFPDFVKNAELDDIRSTAGLVPGAYADDIHLKFACASPAATWLSSLYFYEQKDSMPKAQQLHIEARLQKFAEHFGIANELRAAREKVAVRLTPEELPDSDYAYVWQDEEQGVQRFYPLTTPSQIKQAAEWLHSIRDKMIFEDRHAVAKRILEKAGQSSAGLSDEMIEFLDKQAGMGVPDIGEIRFALKQRMVFAKDASLREEIRKLDDLLKDTPQFLFQPADAIKLASVIEDIDESIGLRGRYSDGVKRAEDVIFGYTHRKVAADVASLCPLVTGAMYEKAQFGRLTRDVIESNFGEKAAEDLCIGFDVSPEKFAKFASELSHTHARQLEMVMAEIGEHSQISKAGGSLALPAADLEAMAREFTRALDAAVSNQSPGSR
jgi:hypothetical protein